MKHRVVVEVETDMDEQELKDEIKSWLEDLTGNDVVVEEAEE